MSYLREERARKRTPYSGHVFVFRGRRGDLVKMLWWDGDGLYLCAKRLERGRFVWPQADQGVVSLSRAQLSMLLEGAEMFAYLHSIALLSNLSRQKYLTDIGTEGYGHQESGSLPN
jgi:transposase